MFDFEPKIGLKFIFARKTHNFASYIDLKNMPPKIYPRTGDTQTVYLNAVVQDPSIEIGDYTISLFIRFVIVVGKVKMTGLKKNTH